MTRKKPDTGETQIATKAYITGTAEITALGRAALMEAMEDEAKADALLHTLDHCPPGSKLVGTEQGTVLARPDGGEGRGAETILPKTDLAGRLPAGALIQKIRDGVYRGVQLDSGREDQPALITATAYENITQFVTHFHG